MTADVARPSYDCLTCGACCASPFLGEGYIQLDDDEEARMRRKGLPVLEIVASPPEDRIVLLGTRSQGSLRTCCALRGKLNDEVFCTVYEDRPHLCREFEAGSPECLAARRAVGMDQ